MRVNVKNKFKYKHSDVSMLASVFDTKIDENVLIKPFVHLERSFIGSFSSLGTFSSAFDCNIGKFCSIARDVYIGGASHPLDHVSSSGFFYINPSKKIKAICLSDYNWHSKKTTIGNDVWIGVKAIIKAGVSIGDGAVIGAGSVVTKDVPAYEIWGGNPAKLIRKRFDDETIKKLLEIKWWDFSATDLKRLGEYMKNPDEFLAKIKEVKQNQ